MDETKLKIEFAPLDSIKPYSGNAKLHPPEQIEQIKESIRRVGFRDPIGIWHGEIVEGHGRHQAAQELGMTEVPIIRLDDLTDEERRAYMLIHNQTTMNSGWDESLLEIELADITDIDMNKFGFEVMADEEEGELTEKYTNGTEIPHYEVQGQNVSLFDLVNMDKAKQLCEEINLSNLTEEEKAFLKIAACRLYVFNYKKIAEYYAQADAEMQGLMEKLALVIIDYGNAIANGYVKLSKRLEALRVGENA